MGSPWRSGEPWLGQMRAVLEWRRPSRAPPIAIVANDGTSEELAAAQDAIVSSGRSSTEAGPAQAAHRYLRKSVVWGSPDTAEIQAPSWPGILVYALAIRAEAVQLVGAADLSGRGRTDGSPTGRRSLSNDDRVQHCVWHLYYRRSVAEYVLANGAEIYLPFTSEELARLRRYVQRVDTLLSLRFFRSPGESVRLFSRNNGVFTTGTDGFDRETVMALAGSFRILYNPQERISFMAVMKLLASHLRRDGGRYQEALAELRDLRQGRREILGRSTLRMIIERRQNDGSIVEDVLTRERLIDLWLNGELLHPDDEKAAHLEEWDVSGVALFEFCAAVRRFAHLFDDGRVVVSHVLRMPPSHDRSTTP